MKCLSIVIPVLNEDKNLWKLNKLIYKYLKKVNFEILFVDDNSDDNSKKILKKISSHYKKTTFLIRKKERDLTQSCFDGVKNAKFDNILIMDGDLQHHPSNLPNFVNKFFQNEIDILVGTRNFNSKTWANNLGPVRFFISKYLIKVFNLIFGFKTIDPLSGFFIFKKKIYFKNKKFFFGKGYKILIDLIYNSNQIIKVKDHPINFKMRKFKSSKINMKVLLNFIKLLKFII
jgi:dolichol-phosphate mannosyltransferase